MIGFSTGRSNPLSLASTYQPWDTDFTYEHIREIVIDKSVSGDHAPRQVSWGPTHRCNVCEMTQSAMPTDHQFQYFPDLYGAKAQVSYPV